MSAAVSSAPQTRSPVLFNSVTYAYFFAAVFVVSWALAPWRRLRLGFLLCSSYVFYAGWAFVVWPQGLDDLLSFEGPPFWRALFKAVEYVPLIFIATSVDYYLGILLDRINEPRRRKALLIATVCLNVGILVFYKYWNWGAVTMMAALGALGVENPNIPLQSGDPIGISFFCFMSLSYVIDVYRRTIPACKSYLNYLTYISFFPHLVAGPIIRGRDLLPHLERPTQLSAETGGEGLFLIASGLFKKIVIGDYIAVHFVDKVFGEPTSYSAVEVMVAMYGYAVQIYCDFAGYSDVAIGSALLLGYRFKLNFDAPFKSTNIGEFWRRWHISLSTWLRDYVFFPLGGSGKGAFRRYFNITATMFICGIWHGAAWTFFVFGCIQGLGLAVTHWFIEARRSAKKALSNLRGLMGVILLTSGICAVVLYFFGHRGVNILLVLLVAMGAVVVGGLWAIDKIFGEASKWPARIFAVAANFTFVALTFTMFRAQSLAKAGAMYERLISFTFGAPNLHRNVVLIIIGALVLQWTPRDIYDRVRRGFIRAPAPLQAVVLLGVALALREAAHAEAQPFVYFQF